MTEVWKSNARKFCELCKVWFADNKVSIEHHEAGRKHKEAIQAKLRELGKQNKAKQEKEKALQATLAKMEAAAKMSLAQGASAATGNCAAIGPSPKPRSYMDPRAHSSVAAMAQEMAKRKREAAAALATKSQHWRDDDEDEPVDEPTVKKERKDEIVWAETSTDDGVPYYFHIYSGETVWETPKTYYTVEEYKARLAELDSAINARGDDGRARALTAPRRAWGLKAEDNNHSMGETKLNRAARRAHLATTHQAEPLTKTEPIPDTDHGDHPVDPAIDHSLDPAIDHPLDPAISDEIPPTSPGDISNPTQSPPPHVPPQEPGSSMDQFDVTDHGDHPLDPAIDHHLDPAISAEIPPPSPGDISHPIQPHISPQEPGLSIDPLDISDHGDHPIDPAIDHFRDPAICAEIPPTNPGDISHPTKSPPPQISQEPGLSMDQFDITDIPTPDCVVPEATSDQPSIPYEESAAIAASFQLEDHDIPLPPPQDPAAGTTVKADITPSGDNRPEAPVSEEGNRMKQEPEDGRDGVLGDDETTSTAEVPEVDGVKEEQEETARPELYFSRPSPYGAWRRVTKPVEQPKVDYELPTEEEGRVAKKEEVIRPEDIVEFTEKTAPVSNKKKKKDVPITFKKRKANINTRRRDGD